jgi:hypothetical protein
MTSARRFIFSGGFAGDRPRVSAQGTDDDYRGLLISRSRSATGRFMVFE